jgi:hypothetical protein
LINDPTQMSDPARIAIACATGGFKGAFVGGVLAAFEADGFQAGAYAGASSSVLPAAAAAVGDSGRLGLEHWLIGQRIMARPKTNMSTMILAGIEENQTWLKKRLFAAGARRLLIAASAVSQEAAGETQGQGARRRGRLLLLAAARGDSSWIDEHLRLALFDSAGAEPLLPLNEGNFEAAAYASTRMLHAWDVPGWVDGRPYVDAYYTCACPAVEMIELGYEQVIAVATEPTLYRDIMQDQTMPQSWRGRPVHVIRPAFDPCQQGVNYTTASQEGLARVYQHGQAQAKAFLARFWA